MKGILLKILVFCKIRDIDMHPGNLKILLEIGDLYPVPSLHEVSERNFLEGNTSMFFLSPQYDIYTWIKICMNCGNES